MKEKCVLYVRVSTILQEYERQISELTTFAKLRDFEIAETFEDKLSGFKNDNEREGLKNLLKYVDENNIKKVLIWEISRLSRKKRFLEDILEDFFDKKQINIYFYKENVWSLDEKTLKRSFAANLSISILSAMAENEVETMKDRFLSQKTLNESLGKYNGGKIKFGYKLDSDNKYVLNNEIIPHLNVSEVDIIKEMFKLYESGLVCSKICRINKSKNYPKIVTNTHTLARILRDKAYIGEHKAKLAKRPMPRIISDQQFYNVQRKVDTNKTKADKGHKHDYLLRGILKCKYCNRYYVGKQTDDGYICPLNSGSNKTNNQTVCKGENISISNVDGVIWNRVKDYLIDMKKSGFDYENKSKQKQKTSEFDYQIELYKKLLETIEKGIKKINKMFENDAIDIAEYEIKIKEKNSEKGKVLKDIANIESEKINYLNQLIESESVVNQLKRINAINDRKQIKTLIKSVVKEIVFYKIGLFRTVLRVDYFLGGREYLIYNTVSKKGNYYFKIDPNYILYEDSIKQFYFIKDPYSIQDSIKTEILKSWGIRNKYPDYLPLHEFYKILKENKLDDKLKISMVVKYPIPNKDNSIQISFDTLIKYENLEITLKTKSPVKKHIIQKFEYSKMTYFKELKKERFNRKKLPVKSITKVL